MPGSTYHRPRLTPPKSPSSFNSREYERDSSASPSRDARSCLTGSTRSPRVRKEREPLRQVERNSLPPKNWSPSDSPTALYKLSRLPRVGKLGSSCEFHP